MQSKPSFNISGVILAGGEGTRLGLGPKALVMLAGKPLVSHVIARLKPQTQSLAINVRAPTDWATALGHDVITDTAIDAGPLAGVAAALVWAKTQNANAVLTCPADSPFIPPDLCAQLAASWGDEVEIAIASSRGQRHHLVALWRAGLIDRLTSHIKNGASPVHRFQDQCRVKVVNWPLEPGDPFFNINTRADLTMAENMFSGPVSNRSAAQ